MERQELKYTTEIIGIYRPPYCEAHPVSPNVFLEEFSAYLENIVMCPEVLLISGDFNFHLDSHTDSDADKFSDLLETFGLIRHVITPTHSSGHILRPVQTHYTRTIQHSTLYDRHCIALLGKVFKRTIHGLYNHSTSMTKQRIVG